MGNGSNRNHRLKKLEQNAPAFASVKSGQA
jgi:hypothetical protein